MRNHDFVHLHLHTHYSILDSTIKIADLMQKAKEFKMPAVAITDHGNMFGAMEFYKYAIIHGIKPIIGCEVYVAPGSRHEKTGIRGASAYHLVLLAKNETGFKNLMKLVSLGYVEGFYRRPRIDKEILRQYSEGLIALSACLKGEIPYFLARGNNEKACQIAEEYKTIFPDRHFFLEIQENGIEEQTTANKGLMEMATKLDIPLVATNDCHHLEKKDAKGHEALICVQTGMTKTDMEMKSFPMIDQFYFKSQEEMIHAFDYCPEAIKNTIEIAERCNLKLDSGHVAQMATFRNRRAKGAIRDAGRARDMSYKEIKQIVSLIPKKSNITIKEAVEIEPRLSEMLKSSPQIQELLEIAGTLEGLVNVIQSSPFSEKN